MTDAAAYWTDADALRHMRAADAAHREARVIITDASRLRLDSLEQALRAAWQGPGQELVELRALPGELPRLWLDLTTTVTMAPDPRTYRVEQEREGGRVTILETEDRAQVLSFAAALNQQRVLAAARSQGLPAPGAAGWTLNYVWILGLITGLAAAATLAISLKDRLF